MQLSTPKQIRKTLFINKKQYEQFINEGMPCLLVGGKVRFDKTEVAEWLQTYIMKQELLEKAFVDAKGRTIEQYVSIHALKECLQLKKKEIVQLCDEGMPCQVIGKKRFFYLEEVLAFVRPQKKNEIKRTSQSKPVVIIVDGSHHPETKEICTGMVVQDQEKIQGFSRLHETRIENAVYCEYLALYHALRYVKEQQLTNVVIGTDQMNFVTILKRGEIKYFEWMKKEPFREVMNEMYALMAELKQHVRIVYANVPHYAKLYKNAHALSRYYENKCIDAISPDQPLTVIKKIERSVPSLNLVTLPKNHADAKHTLQIKFDSAEDKYLYFNVTIGGKSKQTKMLNTTPTRAAILLAYSYVQTAKEKMTVYIDAIPTFEEDLITISSSHNPIKTSDIIEKLYEVTDFHPKNDFGAYVQEIKEKTNIA